MVRNISFNRMLILWYVSIKIISRFVVFIKTKYIFFCVVLFCGMCETVIKITGSVLQLMTTVHAFISTSERARFDAISRRLVF